jgi:peptide chain release factor 2
MAEPDFWNNREGAQETVVELKGVRSVIEPIEKIESKLEELQVLAELAEEDEEAEREFASGRAEVELLLNAAEFQTMLSGRDDRLNAYLTVHAGAGGTESCDWTQMLLRLYTHWADRHGYKTEIIDELPGEEAGLRSATMHVTGDWAFGYLKAEIGIHRLVRISPFDANKRRHTSFASVDVTPELEEDAEVEIKEAEIRVETCRAGGAGGQHVNKTESVVRIVHLPTGLVVRCQNDRSQHKNRRTAMKMLAAKLHALHDAERRAESAAAYDAKGEVSFGYQIRSYVLQPYQMVKDLRTDVETGNVQAVLDGEIDEFIEAYLKLAASKRK